MGSKPFIGRSPDFNWGAKEAVEEILFPDYWQLFVLIPSISIRAARPRSCFRAYFSADSCHGFFQRARRVVLERRGPFIFLIFLIMSNPNKPAIDNTPVHIEVNGVKGVALQPFEGPTRELLALAKGKTKALFVDLAATPQMQETIARLAEEGVETVAYRDHHYAPESADKRDQETAANAQKVIAQLGDKARFEERKNAPSCSRLVELGEATREKIDLILHHSDADGFLGYLKACGVSYPRMEEDADILDSRGDVNKLTEQGKLYKEAMVSVPAFDKARPDISNKAKQVIQQEFLAYIQSNFSEETAKPLKEKAQAALEQAQTTQELIKAIQVLEGGIAFVDTTTVGKRKFDVKALGDAMEKIKGVRVAAQKKSSGPLASPEKAQISIARPAADTTTDLRVYLPEGAQSGVEHGRIFNTPFLLHVREDLFEDFANRFKAAQTAKTEENKK